LAGEEVGGEAGQFGGSFVGGAPGSARAIAQRTLAPFFRGRTTADVSGAAARQGIQPSLGSVSGAMGRLFTKAVAATPGVGGGVREANDRFTEAIRQRQREIATDVYGDTLPGNISDEDIGGALIAGARQGSANITQRATTEQQQLIHGAPAQPARPATPTPPPSPSLPLDEHELFMMQERARGNGVPGPTTPGQPAQPATPGIGANAPVDARSVYYGPAGYSNTALHGDPSTYPAYKARLDNIRQTAIQAQQPFWQNFWGQLAAGEIPYERFQALRSNLGADLEGYSGMTGGQKDQLYEAMTNAMREAARARGGQALVDRFDAANANYKRLIGDEGQRSKLEAIGGAPQSGGWDQFFGPQGQTRPAVGVDFTGGKGEEGAAEWFKGHLQSPEKLAPFADPTIVPNEFWRRVVGQWLATRGQTKEGTFRPDQMAAELSGGAPGAEISTNKGVGGTVSTQLFTGPQGSTTANINDVNDIATLGRNSVVAQNRAGLTDAAGSVYALKWLADQAQHAFGAAGGLGTMLLAGRNLSDPDFVNAVRGQGTPLVNSLYAGVPAASQNILQYQTNPPAAYDPLGYSVTAGQSPQ
jgi:hypothetical protein